jgi:acetyltransferase-like isoleucine patch superfamily enzyme
MSRITTALRHLFGANPVGIAFQLIAVRSWAKTKSFFMGISLQAPGLYLGPGCRVIGARHISLGRGVFAARNLWLEAVTRYQSQNFHPEITIGDYVCFSEGVHISAILSVTVGNHTLFGSKIYVSDHNHGVYRGEHQSRPEEPPARRVLGGGGPVVIGENVWIGDNVVIVGPATIGNGVIVGANSVVRGSVPPNTMVAGTPARPVKAFNSNTGLWDKV